MRCEACEVGHHQGCLDTVACRPVREGARSCQCPCRPVEWRKG